MCVCVDAKKLVQLCFLSIHPLFIILPLFPLSPLFQTSLLLIIGWLSYLWVILSADNLSQVLSVGLVSVYLCISLCLPPSRLSDATVTFTCWHLAWGLLLWSLATAVCSHPLKFIYPNLRWSLEALLAMGHKGQNQNTHTHHCVFPLCDLLLCVSPLENSLFSTLQSIDSQLHFALSLLLVLALPL